MARAQRELVRIGIDRPAAAAVGAPADWSGGEPLAGFRRATFAELADALAGDGPPAVLDVRRNDERAEARIPGSVHVPIHELLGRLDEVPTGPVWVHCAGGYRAGVVAALLQARGHAVVSVDDEFDRALMTGLAVRGAAEGRVA